jgi:hypothetical protein
MGARPPGAAGRVGGPHITLVVQDRFGPIVVDLAGSGRLVTATTMSQHQRADVHLRGAVEDRAPHREHGVLLPTPPQDVDRDRALGVQRVHEEAVVG